MQQKIELTNNLQQQIKNDTSSLINQQLVKWQEDSKPFWVEILGGLRADQQSLMENSNSTESNVSKLLKAIEQTPVGNYDNLLSNVQLHLRRWKKSYILTGLFAVLIVGSIIAYLGHKNLYNDTGGYSPWVVAIIMGSAAIIAASIASLVCIATMIFDPSSSESYNKDYQEHAIAALLPEHLSIFNQIKYEYASELAKFDINIESVADLKLLLEKLAVNLPIDKTDLIVECFQLINNVEMFINACEKSFLPSNSKTDLTPWKKDIPSEWELKDKISNYQKKFSVWSQETVDNTIIDIGNIQYEEETSLLAKYKAR